MIRLKKIVFSCCLLAGCSHGQINGERAIKIYYDGPTDKQFPIVWIATKAMDVDAYYKLEHLLLVSPESFKRIERLTARYGCSGGTTVVKAPSEAKSGLNPLGIVRVEEKVDGEINLKCGMALSPACGYLQLLQDTPGLFVDQDTENSLRYLWVRLDCSRR